MSNLVDMRGIGKWRVRFERARRGESSGIGYE